MKEAPLSEYISKNLGRAAQDGIGGDSKSEITHLLFAMKDIAHTLKTYRVDRMSLPPTEWLDLDVAKRYTVVLQRSSKRIAELIEQGA